MMAMFVWNHMFCLLLLAVIIKCNPKGRTTRSGDVLEKCWRCLQLDKKLVISLGDTYEFYSKHTYWGDYNTNSLQAYHVSDKWKASCHILEQRNQCLETDYVNCKEIIKETILTLSFQEFWCQAIKVFPNEAACIQRRLLDGEAIYCMMLFQWNLPHLTTVDHKGWTETDRKNIGYHLSQLEFSCIKRYLLPYCGKKAIKLMSQYEVTFLKDSYKAVHSPILPTKRPFVPNLNKAETNYMYDTLPNDIHCDQFVYMHQFRMNCIAGLDQFLSVANDQGWYDAYPIRRYYMIHNYLHKSRFNNLCHLVERQAYPCLKQLEQKCPNSANYFTDALHRICQLTHGKLAKTMEKLIKCTEEHDERARCMAPLTVPYYYTSIIMEGYAPSIINRTTLMKDICLLLNKTMSCLRVTDKSMRKKCGINNYSLLEDIRDTLLISTRFIIMNFFNYNIITIPFHLQYLPEYYKKHYNESLYLVNGNPAKFFCNIDDNF